MSIDASQTRTTKRPTPAPAKVTPTPKGLVQRQCACGGKAGVNGECAGCRKKRLEVQRNPAETPTPNTAGEVAPPIVHQVLRSTGRPLDATTRTFMESSLGHDFSQVRIHTDAQAAASARAVAAQAYTVGDHLVFATGRHEPRSVRGKTLIAHELVHHLQQRDASEPANSELRINRPGDALEQEADRLAQGRLRSGVEKVPKPIGVQRKVLTRQVQRTVAGTLTGLGIGAGAGALIGGAIGLGVGGPIGGLIGAGIGLLAGGLIGLIIGALVSRKGFREHPNEEYAGYDGTTSPDSLVVPQGGSRRVGFRRLEPETTFHSLNPGVATISRTNDGAAIQGVSDGAADIVAREGEEVVSRLQVDVKDRRDETVDFHFMRDTGGHQTTRSQAQAASLTTTLNRIWERQANVRFTQGVVDTPQIGSDLGGEIDAVDASSPEWTAVTASATGGSMNVFFVWSFETPGAADTNAAQNAGNIIIEDDECSDGLTIAHEAGHFLGQSDHAASGIMSSCPGNDRRRVNKDLADVVNP